MRFSIAIYPTFDETYILCLVATTIDNFEIRAQLLCKISNSNNVLFKRIRYGKYTARLFKVHLHRRKKSLLVKVRIKNVPACLCLSDQKNDVINVIKESSVRYIVSFTLFRSPNAAHSSPSEFYRQKSLIAFAPLENLFTSSANYKATSSSA